MSQTKQDAKGAPIKKFLELNLTPAIIKAIEGLGHTNPTKVQQRVIPLIAKKRDVIAASKSGTGKTATYVLPMLNRLSGEVNERNRTLRALILVPTRELVDQVSKNIEDYGKHTKIKHTKLQGGVPKSKQESVLEGGVEVIVATPGRLIDFIDRDIVNLESVNFVILDEADTMLDMGFRRDIKYILSYCSPHRQICMFSATISQNIRKLAKDYLRNPETVEVSQRRDRVALIKHQAFKVDIKRKHELLAKLAKSLGHEQILVFVNTKEAANELLEKMLEHKVQAVAIHGDIEYVNRSKAIKAFRAKSKQVLIATDIAGRGIDIQELPLVINYELPDATDDFTHRVGRTGRAGNEGLVITLLNVTEYNRFTRIERHLKLNVKREVHPSFPLKDRQPRQKVMPKKSLEQKKGKRKPKEPKAGAKSKKTTKRDPRPNFKK